MASFRRVIGHLAGVGGYLRTPHALVVLLVVEESSEGVLLQRCRADGSLVSSSWHVSVEDAMSAASSEHEFVTIQWSDVPVEVDDAAAFGLARIPGFHFVRVDSEEEVRRSLALASRSIVIPSKWSHSRLEFLIGALPEGTVAMCLSLYGLPPQTVIDRVSGVVWVGYEDWVVVVDLPSWRVRRSHTVECMFNRFVLRMADGSMIVHHELGITRLRADGSVMWVANAPDVVEECVDRGADLLLHTHDGDVVVDKDTGSSRRV